MAKSRLFPSVTPRGGKVTDMSGLACQKSALVSYLTLLTWKEKAVVEGFSGAGLSNQKVNRALKTYMSVDTRRGHKRG